MVRLNHAGAKMNVHNCMVSCSLQEPNLFKLKLQLWDADMARRQNVVARSWFVSSCSLGEVQVYEFICRYDGRQGERVPLELV